MKFLKLLPNPVWSGREMWDNYFDAPASIEESRIRLFEANFIGIERELWACTRREIHKGRLSR